MKFQQALLGMQQGELWTRDEPRYNVSVTIVNTPTGPRYMFFSYGSADYETEFFDATLSNNDQLKEDWRPITETEAPTLAQC